MKNRDLIDSIDSINAVAALKQPVRTSFVIALNLKAVRDHMSVLDTQREELVAKHALKGADGKPLPVYASAVDKDGKSILDDLGDPRLDADGKPILDKDGKPAQILERRVRLKGGGKAFQTELDELLDIDVTSDIRIRPVKLSLLEGSVEPQHLVSVLWMLNDDVSEKQPV